MKKYLFLLLLLALSPALYAFAQQYGWVDISANIPGTPDLSDVFFVSDDEGWITSSSHAEIYHTTDGGETFEIQTTLYTCNAIHMLNANEGFAGGASGFIYKTTNGGENWYLFGTMRTTLADISFPPNGDTGYCCGINGNIWSIASTGVTKMNSGVPDNLYSISFPRNSNEGWVCGGSIIRHFINGDWTAVDQDYPSGGHNAIYMVDTLNGWAVGDNGIISHTSDGQNWFEQANADPQLNTFYSTYFLNTSEGWTVGLSGTLVHTINGGDNWNIEAEGLTTKHLQSVHFTSPTNGYVVGNGKTLLKYSELTTGVKQEVEDLTFEIYPNPAAEKFRVQCSELCLSADGFKVEDARIEIYDLNGRKLLEKQIPVGSENLEIDVSDLESGVYFCKIITEKYSATKKIIIK